MMTEEIEDAVDEMCHLCQDIKDAGIRYGMAIGRDEGKIKEIVECLQKCDEGQFDEHIGSYGNAQHS